MEGFIRGGPGQKAVKLIEILPENMKGFSRQTQQEPFADAWEAKNGRYVERPWLSDEQNAEAKAKFDEQPKAAVPEVGMSKDRAERQLAALWSGYNPSQEPEQLAIAQREIHRCEQILGRPLTDFERDVAKKKDQIPEKLANQLKKYLSIKEPKERKRVVANVKNLPLLKLIREQEEVSEITDLVVQRIAELELE